MPRKPVKRKPNPLTFSRFARSIAQVAYVSMFKHQTHRPKFLNISPASAGNVYSNISLAENSGQSETSSSDDETDGVIQADFAFFDPKPSDFHGAKILLQAYLDNKQWDLTGFVDLVLGQITVGTVVKLEDDDENNIFSVVTALNLDRYKDHKCIKDIKEFLHKVCREKDVVDELELLFGEKAHDVGLLVSQRVTNLPPQILPPLYDALFDEVSWATEDEPTEELRSSFCFKYYLLITKVYKHKSSGKGKSQSVSYDDAIIYVKPEDEVFHKLSLLSFSYPLHIQHVTAPELRNYQHMGLVMVLEAEKIQIFRQQLRSLIIES